MATMTISIPEDLKKRIDGLPEINWTEVVRNGFVRKLKMLKEVEKLSK